jgi:hypothetical protein
MSDQDIEALVDSLFPFVTRNTYLYGRYVETVDLPEEDQGETWQPVRVDDTG